MTAIAPASTTESRAAALAMFAGQVPCVLQLADPPCPNAARWLAVFTHEENTATCGGDEPQPVCDEHKRAVQMGSHPFWRTWNNSPPLLCDWCQTPLRLDRFESLQGSGG
jgi:hypothetical protein